MKLGSLFDGIGGFPFAGIWNGIIPVWASEIEPFPTEVTKKYFPDMKHLGNILQINGFDIEPVDIITAGSPCQDLSVAGKREGLAGQRSGLFMEFIRIVREMQIATGGKYPRFIIWENVPGAFSSNRGQDFRAVLEEISETEIPMPPSGHWKKRKDGTKEWIIDWAPAGMVRRGGCDIAWRTFDAQYWGVPQRRKRIKLIADFGGQCAAEILFEPEGLPWDTAESGEAREEATRSSRNGVETTVNLDQTSDRITINAKKSVTLKAGGGGGGAKTGLYLLPQPIAFNGRQDPVYGKVTGALDTDRATQCVLIRASGFSKYTEGEVAECLRAMQHKQTDVDLVVAQCITTGTGRRYDPETETLIPVAFGPGGQHDIAHALRSQPNKADKPSSTTYVAEPTYACKTDQTGSNGLGICEEVAYTLDSASGQAVAYPDPANTLLAKANLSFRGDQDNLVAAVDCRNLYETEELSGTLQSKQTGGYSLNYQKPVRVGYRVRRLTPLECERLMGFPDEWTNIPGGSDTARYKAIGNSIAIPPTEWILTQLRKAVS